MIHLNWHQVKVITIASLKARYRKTFIGFGWVLLGPILMYSIQAFVFQHFLKIQIENYYLFLLGGLLPWIFISHTWENSISLLVNHSGILKSFHISPNVLVASSIIDHFINYICAFFLILLPVIALTKFPGVEFLYFPITLFLLIVFVFTTTRLLSTLFVFYRDIKYVTQFLMSVLFFITPVFYPESMVPEKYGWLVDYNPIYMVISPIRETIYPTDGITIPILKSFILNVLLLIISSKVWSKKKNEIYLKL